jgi:MtN3 and saliva related transmembrane protein
MTILATLATASGVVMAFANFPQAYKIWKRKSAKDIAITSYAIFFLGGIIWLLYGIEIGSVPIIATQIAGITSCTTVMIGWLKYR